MQKGAINNEPRNLRTAVIFDSVEIVYNYGLNWGTVCRIFRFIYHFFLKLYIHCWIYFHSMVLESVGRDYCKKRVLEFLAEMFWLGCFSLFRGKSSTRMKNSCILNYNKGKANNARLSVYSLNIMHIPHIAATNLQAFGHFTMKNLLWHLVTPVSLT